MKLSKISGIRNLSAFVCMSALIPGFVVQIPAQQQGPRAGTLRYEIATDASIPNEKIIPMPGNRQNSAASARRPGAAKGELTEEQRILHFLNRAGFGPLPGDITRIGQIGLDNYLDEQLNPEEMPEERLGSHLIALGTLHLSIPETIQAFSPPPPTPTPAPAPKIDSVPEIGSIKTPEKPPSDPVNAQPAMTAMPQNPEMNLQMPAPTPRRDPMQPLRELQQAKLIRAAYSNKQLQEVMVDFWFNHFNVFAAKNVTRWTVTSYERDVIRPHALGNFRDLLIGVAQSPAMLYYLDNFLSQVERPLRRDADGNPLRRPGLNENYARELMELHTLGVDGGYTQEDVTEVARSFTGWTLSPMPNGTFLFRPNIHDRGEKIVLGNRIQAGGGIEDGLRVLNILAKHPSTARHISLKLCKRFVSDDPPPALVERVAGVFKKTGGDIREVLRTILTSPEFYSPENYRTKVKSPFETVVSAIRATAASSELSPAMIQWVQRLGSPLYLCVPPTGYPEDSGQWLNSATLLERMNFAIALVSDKIRGTRADPTRFVSVSYINDNDRIIDRMVAVLLHSQISTETRKTLTAYLKSTREKLPKPANLRESDQQNKELITGLAALIIGSREFQMK